MFKPNPRFADELKQQSDYGKAMRSIANRVKTVAKAVSPKRSGGYSRRFEVIEVFVLRDGVRVPVTMLVNHDIAAHMIEWGSKNNPPYAPLRRAVRAAGHRLEE